jgi:hypothetical protein
MLQGWQHKAVTICQFCYIMTYRTCWNNLATSLIISTRLLQIVISLFQIVDNLGQAVRTQLVDGLLADLLQDVSFCLCTHVKTHKLLQVCKQVVTDLFTSCQQVVFALLVPSCWTSLEQAVNNLEQAWWHHQTCYKVVLTSLIQSW